MCVSDLSSKHPTGNVHLMPGLTNNKQVFCFKICFILFLWLHWHSYVHVYLSLLHIYIFKEVFLKTSFISSGQFMLTIQDPGLKILRTTYLVIPLMFSDVCVSLFEVIRRNSQTALSPAHLSIIVSCVMSVLPAPRVILWSIRHASFYKLKNDMKKLSHLNSDYTMRCRRLWIPQVWMLVKIIDAILREKWLGEVSWNLWQSWSHLSWRKQMTELIVGNSLLLAIFHSLAPKRTVTKTDI